MAKRMILLTLPSDADLSTLPESAHVAATLRGGGPDGSVVVELLLEAPEVEEVLDALQDRWREVESFHAVVLAPEAVLPRPPEPAAESVVAPEPELESVAGRISRDEIIAKVTEGLGASPVFVALTLLSTVVAAVGLLRNDVAVIVGAMVVAPLLQPNVAMALGATLGDLSLILRASRALVAGAIAAFLLSWLIGVVARVDPATPALAARSVLGAGDFALALAAGAAASLAFTRGLAGALIGVMVAVALLPPLTAAGLFAGAGYGAAAAGALLLALVNMICINLSAVASFLATGVRPHGFFAEEKARRSTMVAIVIWTLLLLVLAAIVVSELG